MKENPFIGSWQLLKVEYISFDSPNLYPYGKDVEGLLTYFESGMMSVQLGNLKRPKINGEGLFNGKTDEIIRAFNGYVAYFGRYEIDYRSSMIFHHVEQSMYPDWIGSVQERSFEFSGKLLYLRANELPFGNKMYIPELTWQKL